MKPTPTKPFGSSIEERKEGNSVKLCWPLPNSGPIRFVIAAVLSMLLCAWIFGWISRVGKIVSGSGSGFDILWLALLTEGVGETSWTLWTMLRSPRPESVTLAKGEFVYDPGLAPVDFLQWNFWNLWLIRTFGFGPSKRIAKPVTIPKSELRWFVLNRFGERQRLAFDWGTERIEIGTCLEESEREWLFAVLEDWRTA